MTNVIAFTPQAKAKPLPEWRPTAEELQPVDHAMTVAAGLLILQADEIAKLARAFAGGMEAIENEPRHRAIANVFISAHMFIEDFLQWQKENAAVTHKGIPS